MRKHLLLRAAVALTLSVLVTGGSTIAASASDDDKPSTSGCSSSGNKVPRVLYRVDSRTPSEIKEAGGFKPQKPVPDPLKVTEDSLWLHAHGVTSDDEGQSESDSDDSEEFVKPPLHFVATTCSQEVAYGIAMDAASVGSHVAYTYKIDSTVGDVNYLSMNQSLTSNPASGLDEWIATAAIPYEALVSVSGLEATRGREGYDSFKTLAKESLNEDKTENKTELKSGDAIKVVKDKTEL